MVNNHWLVVWIYFLLFFHSVWNVIIPTDLFIFFRGVCIYTTNQMLFSTKHGMFFLPASFIWLRNADGDLTSPRWGWTFGRPGKEAPWKVMPGLVTTNTLLLKMVIYSWFFHGTWWCSIVMLVYQRLLFRMNDAILGYTDIPHFWAKQVNRMS